MFAMAPRFAFVLILIATPFVVWPANPARPIRPGGFWRLP